MCRINGIILSVDNYVPTASSDHYDRAEQGVFADYVVIMGYDEHYAGSEEAGSVASIGYVQQGIEKTLSEGEGHQRHPLLYPFLEDGCRWNRDQRSPGHE